jgi:LysR family glycine cleavage system transcriptional activator
MPIAKRSNKKSTRKAAPGFPRLPLASLRVFVAAAEHPSFSHAADALGVSAAAVSMQIRALEEYLRTPLFHRRGRLAELTAAGAQLLPPVRNGLAELERAINEARLEQRTGPLTVSMLASFLQQWLLLRLPGFNARHPQFDVRIHTSDRLVDFGHSDVQAAIRFGSGDWPKLHCEKLLDDWVVPVCTPQLLDKHGPVSSHADLRRYRLLHEESEAWSAWLGGATDESAFFAEERRGATFDDAVSVVRAALALTRWSLAAQEVECGRLAIASRTIIRMASAYFFVCPKSYLGIDKIAAFRSWIVEEARRAPRPPTRP